MTRPQLTTQLMLQESLACAALLTPPGRGAVATIRVCCECALLDDAFTGTNGLPVSDQPVDRVVFGQWRSTGEDVVVCRVGEDVVEVHCHGGEAAAERILNDLARAGCRIESWQELLCAEQGLLDTELHEALANATTVRTAQFLLEEQSVLAAACRELCRCTKTDQLLERLDDMLSWSDFGLHLSRPWEVVLSGRPNVGKSSLINRIVGYSRAIVCDQPGTTRDVLTADTACDGWPVRLSDTAGIHGDVGKIELAGIELARDQLRRADVRLILFDTSRSPADDDFELFRAWPSAMVVAHKCDLLDVWGDRVPSAALRVSSLTGQGLGELMRVIVQRIVPRVPPPGTPVPVSQRQIGLLMDARQMVVHGRVDAALVLLRRLFEI